MWVLPHFLESSHAFVCGWMVSLNVIVVAEVVQNFEAEVFESLAEGNISISNVHLGSLRECIILGTFTCCVGLFRFTWVVGERT